MRSRRRQSAEYVKISIWQTRDDEGCAWHPVARWTISTDQL
ncbi:MAG: hypothetical protein WAX12_15070 [Candidatus Microthrix subdominans]|jgi:hypothetical protein|nr:hypothetical protein [Candidatus Microthrix sp.]